MGTETGNKSEQTGLISIFLLLNTSLKRSSID